MSRSNYLRSFLAALICLPVSLAIKGDSACRNSICVAATVEHDLVTCESLVIFEIER